jgi:hypothetical protein
MELNTIIDESNYERDFEEKNVILKKKFDYNKKMELVKRIEKIKKSDYLINIFKIIKTHSKNYNVNNNGIFVFFHDLTDEAYECIEKYVNSIYKLHKKSQSNKINIYDSEFSDSQIIQSILSDTIELNNEKELSNKEKVIKRRKNYAKYLDQNQEN